jgi:hypothetical protein
MACAPRAAGTGRQPHLVARVARLGVLEVGWRGGAPSHARRAARRAVQGQPRPPSPHLETDAAVALMMAVGRAMAEDTSQGDLMGFLRNPVIA